MSLPKVNPIKTKAWQQLQEHYQEVNSLQMRDLFKKNQDRAQQFSISWKDFFLDYSKNRITLKTKELLLQLAEEVGLKDAIDAQFSGKTINETEGRSVGHTLLRDVDNLSSEVHASLLQMKRFSENIISGDHKGYTGKAITHIVNIGIGGSHLGPSMVVDALAYYHNHLEVAYISNVDGDHTQEVLKNLPKETTVFIIVSKSFTTQETLANAQAAREWFLTDASEDDIPQHFVAVSSNKKEVSNFGISTDHMFSLWDWVGGRFSLWSAVGLSACCAIGYDNFKELLLGANKMDRHFQQASFEDNLPVIMALLSVWYNNFFGAETEAVLPYSQYLHSFVDHLQQMNMESNGKSVDRNGEKIDYQTGTIIWGSTGTNAQHAFFQLIHQGTKLIPADFICFKQSLHHRTEQQNMLVANCLAQTEALLAGTHRNEPALVYKQFKGNHPTNTLLVDQLTPLSLGSLIALYEHKMFVQGVIWNIFSFDQWGVELGKKIAVDTLKVIENNGSNVQFTSSTQQLLKKLQNE